ncbi:hypothetical protein NOR_00923 [Metarhizium rileyi]|uniref:Uncharacterized protein n=1 Tax=Metarhizium rileyi (strain RCEF 4871) TaxID=1649241 RepID=A0A167JLV6_METRR|nr:hypothetical protein NOR_00923 [Metarhizium rileyi RCEF 4871]TWU75836.1 hypothetical protein ED733_005021 [Metarhizium rileyi]
MGSRAVSPGGALLRTSRMFSVPKPLPEPPSTSLHIGDHKSATMTRQYPQHQSITTPLSSREKGDWGYKRPFPLKSTMTTSTPMIRVKKVDSVENVTDFASAADHSLSLEKFQELHVAMSAPRCKMPAGLTSTSLWPKSVFEEDLDSTDTQSGRSDDKRWKFRGPWLARMGEGEFVRYLRKTVQPKRAQFRALLKRKLAEDITMNQNKTAMEKGTHVPPRIEVRDITEAHFSEYLRTLRNDRATLYGLVSEFLDLAPLSVPIGLMQGIQKANPSLEWKSPDGKSGPPPSHPSAGISYLRTNSFMENHPVYGPQARRTPTLARVVYPRAGFKPAKLGVGGFVADVPSGDNEFNFRFQRPRIQASKLLNGIAHLDTTTYGGAKAYIEAKTATVDTSGRVVLQLQETHPEAQVIAKESKGKSHIYQDAETRSNQATQGEGDGSQQRRLERITDEMLNDGS